MRGREGADMYEGDHTARTTFRVGSVLSGKYRLDRVLGVGGMASVYAATHLRNANVVAVKVLHRELSIDAGLRARFLREGYAANSVGHPGTVRVLDDDTAEDGSVFIVMDLLDGETLDARWERSGRRLGVSEVVTLMSELLEVLAAAHEKGVVHRDLKPENLFVTREGKLRVLDFGVARLREGSPTKTKTGAVFGTPAFMPPEQALGRTSEVDAVSDIWAVGATAFCLLAGRFVHTGTTAEEMLVRSATEPAQSVLEVVPDLPTAVGDVIDRALAFNKRDRWPSATVMRAALLRADATGTAGDDRDDDAEEERTRIALPPKMTLRGEVAPSLEPTVAKETLEITTLPLAPASTVAGIESHSEPNRTRRGFPLLGVVGGCVTLGMVVAVVVALASGSKQPSSTTEASAVSPLVSSNEAVAAPPLPTAPSSTPTIARSSASEPPAISFEALAVAPPIRPATITKAAPPAPVPVTATRPAPSATTFTASPQVSLPAPSRLRDPLAP
jgi:serine/threonine protein kinase